MASIYKTFTDNDKATTKQPLHESIPITGSIISGTYSEEHVKNYGHGMWQSVYDYPYLSASSNHIFDLAFGYSSTSVFSSSTSVQNSKKINMYNQMAKILVGTDLTGSIQEFDADGDIAAGSTKLKDVCFLNFSRLLYKDEIKKGSFSIVIGSGSLYEPQGDQVAFDTFLTINDSGSAGTAPNYRVNSPAGEYGFLYDTIGVQQGLIYYQAGVAVLTGSLFGTVLFGTGSNTFIDSMTGSTIASSANGFRRRWYNCAFNNTVELNSEIYFCRAFHNEFNYSANPTYVSSSKIQVKNEAQDEPVTYITTIGLYSADNELLAVAKLSEPSKKTPSNELNLRVRLDY